MEQQDGGRLEDVFEDLEQQAAGLELAERDAELADRARGEYAAVTLADRVHASLGQPVTLLLDGGVAVTGVLDEAGSGWCAVVTEQGRTWLVPLPAIAVARGLSPRALPEAARPVLARLGLASAVHRLAADSAELLLYHVAGAASRVRLLRVGADFLEVEPLPGGGATTEVVALGALRAVVAE